MSKGRRRKTRTEEKQNSPRSFRSPFPPLLSSHLARDQHVVPRDHLDVHAHLHGLLDRLLGVEAGRVQEGQHADELPDVLCGQLGRGIGASDGHAADAAEAVLGDLERNGVEAIAALFLTRE